VEEAMHNDQDQSRSERDLAAGPAESDRAYEPLDDLQQRSPIRRRLQALRAIGFAPK
jgi:hypothetical protein